MSVVPPPSNLPKADWYPNPQTPGQLRYWDGSAWTEHYAPDHRYQQPQVNYGAPQYGQPQPQQFHSTGPMTSAGMNVHRDVIYTRPQTGHSLILWLILSFFLVGLIGLVYFSVSPNHYWHA